MIRSEASEVENVAGLTLEQLSIFCEKLLTQGFPPHTKLGGRITWTGKLRNVSAKCDFEVTGT